MIAPCWSCICHHVTLMEGEKTWKHSSGRAQPIVLEKVSIHGELPPHWRGMVWEPLLCGALTLGCSSPSVLPCWCVVRSGSCTHQHCPHTLHTAWNGHVKNSPWSTHCTHHGMVHVMEWCTSWNGRVKNSPWSTHRTRHGMVHVMERCTSWNSARRGTVM